MSLVICLGLSLNFTFQGCNSVEEGYTTRLDTLDQMLDETSALLQIDFSTIEERKNLIFDHLRYVDQFYDQEMSLEFANGLSKYKGIKKAYTHFTKEYHKIVDRTNVLKKQASDLRTSVEKKELTKEEFKKFYAQEKHNIMENKTDAEHLSSTVLSLEPEYQRISRMVYDELKRIAESNDTLSGYLKNIYEPTDTTGS